VRLCEKCGYAKKLSKTEIILRAVIGLLASFGFCFVLLLSTIGFHGVADIYMSASLTDFAGENVNELRHIALNYTDYDGSNSFGFAEDLFMNMPRIRYVRSSVFQQIYDPLETLEYGGDCKNSAVLFVGLMKSVGHDAWVECNLKELHCVTIVPHKINGKELNEYAVIDLTSDTYSTYNNDVDHWINPGKTTYSIDMYK